MNQFEFELVMKKILFFYERGNFGSCLDELVLNETGVASYLTQQFVDLLKILFDENRSGVCSLRAWAVENVTPDYLEMRVRSAIDSEGIFF